MISIDGNFQYSRMKNAAPNNYHKVETPMFPFGYDKRTIAQSDNPTLPNVDSIEDCGHFFNAAQEKPKSMKDYDETGLLGAVCWHRTSLRYINTYQEERMEQCYQLLKSVVGLEEQDAQWGMMYDIGCRFVKWSDARDADILSGIKVSALNAKLK